MCAYAVCLWVPSEDRKGDGFPEGSCELRDVDPRNKTLVLCKSNKPS